MPTTVENLAAQASALSAEDRARLAELLLASLQEEDETESETAWDTEIQRRVEQLQTGTAKLVAAEDVHAEARKLYR